MTITSWATACGGRVGVGGVVTFEPAEAEMVWLMLEEMREEYEGDLKTGYGGDPNFGHEDVKFLQGQLDLINRVKSKMIAMGYRG